MTLVELSERIPTDPKVRRVWVNPDHVLYLREAKHDEPTTLVCLVGRGSMTVVGEPAAIASMLKSRRA